VLRHRRRDGPVVQGAAQLLVRVLEDGDVLLDRSLVESLDVDDHRVDPVHTRTDGLVVADVGLFAHGPEATARASRFRAGAR
jgi:hypothetical protein